MRAKKVGPQIHGLLAQFGDSEQLLEAARMAREAGYTQMDAYTPFAVEGLAEQLGNNDDRVPKVVFAAGILGAAGGFYLQYYVTNVFYPLNVGGRPNFSWPSFIPITFECGVLVASFGAVVGMLLLNGLPRPHHPVFSAPGFERATDDKFFLCIEAADAKFDAEGTRSFLESTNAEKVVEAPL